MFNSSDLKPRRMLLLHQRELEHAARRHRLAREAQPETRNPAWRRAAWLLSLFL